MKLLAITLVLSCLVNPLYNSSCKCEQPAPGDRTHWGQENVIIKEEQIFKTIHGKVSSWSNDRPLVGVLVEVFDRPEGLLLSWREREERKSKQRRIAACITGEDGEFCFANIPAGKYELRASKPVEWNATSIYVVVAPRNRKSTDAKLSVPMYLSQ
jgi:protocatechuate 3,4-dioxygenase beta subunit